MIRGIGIHKEPQPQPPVPSEDHDEQTAQDAGPETPLRPSDNYVQSSLSPLAPYSSILERYGDGTHLFASL